MNLANKITFLRLFLVPVYIMLFLYTSFDLLTLIVFIVASSTDFLDGYIARKYNMVTDLGKFLDPLVDKILTISAFIIFTYYGILHPIILIVIVSREIIISVFRAICAGKNTVIAASIWGKLKTISQMACIILTHYCLVTDKYFTGSYFPFLIKFLQLVMLILTVISAYDYIYKNRNCLWNGV